MRVRYEMQNEHGQRTVELIVAEGQRSSGSGAKLLQAAEAWAKSKGCINMSVRSNVVRDRAHAFYIRNRYEHYKTQKAFRKSL